MNLNQSIDPFKNLNFTRSAGDEVIIVDEFTGRTMPGRRWSEGLHQVRFRCAALYYFALCAALFCAVFHFAALRCVSRPFTPTEPR